MKKKIDSSVKTGLAKLIKDARHPEKIEWLSTGIHAVDLAIGHGIPLGRTLEIFGNESAGKSLLTYSIAKAFQKAGGVVILFDIEATAPMEFMKSLGVDTDSVILPDEEVCTIEDIRDSLIKIVELIRAIEPGIPILAIIDSIAATTSRGEWEDEEKIKAKDNAMGKRAEAFSQFFRKHTVWMAKNNVTLCCVNQMREKIGIVFGNPETTPGGKAVKHHSSIRIKLSQGKKLTLEDKIVGVECKITIEKNKVAAPFKKAILRINQNMGFDTNGGLLEILEQLGRVTTHTGGFQYGEKKYKNSEIETALAENPELLH